MNDLYLVGQWKGETLSKEAIWEMQGVFSDVKVAIKNCVTINYFVAPVRLNQPIKDETEIMPGCFYPLREPDRLRDFLRREVGDVK